MVEPTAKHRVGAVHATPPTSESRPAGTGMACTFQVVPVRTSVKPVAVGVELAPAVNRNPTATQLVPDAHIEGKRNPPIMLTTDMALREDPAYAAITKRFLENPKERKGNVFWEDLRNIAAVEIDYHSLLRVEFSTKFPHGGHDAQIIKFWRMQLMR